MARRCGPNRPCGMSQGLYNPFFQNGAYWYGSGGGVAANSVLYEDGNAARYEDNTIVTYES